MSASHLPDLSGIDPAVRAAVEAMPKVELHVHLEGSIRPATMLALADNNGVDLGVGDERALTERYAFETPDQFFNLFMLGLSVLRSRQDFELVIDQLVDELVAQNVLHAEITTTPWNHLHRGVDPAEYTAALNEGRRRAAERGLSIVWIHDIPRGFEFQPYELTMEFICGQHRPEGALGFGLGGTEVGFPCEQFVQQFERALGAGFRSVPHAGETQGAESVRAAVEELQAERIGHGVRAIEDAALTQQLVQLQLPLEVCPTSNVALKVVPSFEQHPLRRMIEAGLNVSINSDDPAYFSTTLTDELLVAVAYAGCTPDDLRAIQRRAAQASFLQWAERQDLVDRIGVA